MQRAVWSRLLTAGLLLSGMVAGAATKDSAVIPGSSDAVANRVRHEIVMYPYYSIWDDVSFRVSDGEVQLLGAVNQPWKSDDIQRLVEKVPGVERVDNDLKVLPLSPMDDRLRLQVASAIYRDPVFTRYAMQPVPPIHIIVDNGHVTLTGVVDTQMEKEIAGVRASGAGLSFGAINNQLQVEHPTSKKS